MALYITPKFGSFGYEVRSTKQKTKLYGSLGMVEGDKLIITYTTRDEAVKFIERNPRME